MTSGFDAFSLAVFTSLAPGGVVAFIAVALARIGARNREAAVRLDRVIALPFAVVLAGFIASATHLGTPANALHVFSGIGRSPLSNEVLAAVAFLFLAGSYWMAAFKERFPDVVAKPWLALACVAGAALVACTSVAYAVSTVPTWDSPYTPADLVLSAMLTGPVFALLFLELAHARLRPFEGALALLATVALVAGAVVLGMHEASLGGIANNEFSASSLVPDYGAVVALHLALGAAGVVAAAWSLRLGQAERLTLILRVAACVLVLVAVFATRIEFYHLHMTVGF